MKKSCLAMIIICLLSLSGIFFQCRGSSKDFKGIYLGQEPPGLIPKVFAPGLVSTGEYFEFTNIFTPDGKEFYFSRRIDKKDVLMVSKWSETGWSAPEASDILTKYRGFEPHFSSDGKLFMTRFAPPPQGIKETDDPRVMEAQMVNIWVVMPLETGWSEPEYCVSGMYVSTSNSGSLYTTDIFAESEGICVYPYINNRYGYKVHLNGGVNNPKPGAHPCIAPDESFIVFDSKRKDNPNDTDLFVSFKLTDGSWGEAFDLGTKINTEGTEMCAALSHDGKYLFYHSKGDIYWVSTKLIKNLKPAAVK